MTEDRQYFATSEGNPNTSRTTTTTTTSTSTTSNNTVPGVFSDEVSEMIHRAYTSCISSTISGPVLAYLQECAKTMDAGLIVHAIEITAWAPRPSAAYLRAILRRYLAQGIKTIEQAERPRYTAAHGYQEHEYSPQDYENLYIKL